MSALDSATCRGYTDDITGRREPYAPRREKPAQLQRHKAHRYRRDDRRPHRMGGVSGVSEGVSPPAHASHRAHHVPDHVLLHRRGVSLHAEHPQVYRAALHFRADLAFLLHIFLARFHRLALLYSVLLRRRAKPDERYVVARVGSCDAARRGKQKDHVRRGAGSAHSAHLPCELPERLELHRLALRYGVRHEPRRSQKTELLAAFLCCALCGRIFLCHRPRVRHFADGRCALAAGFAAL